MTAHSDDDQRKRAQREREHQQLREMLSQALVAHTMTDEESYAAMLVIAVEDAYADIDDDLGDSHEALGD